MTPFRRSVRTVRSRCGNLRRARRSSLVAIVSAVALAVSAAGTAGASTRSLGSPPPIRFAPTRSYRTGPSPQQVAFADFDGDGTVDLVTANQGGRTVSLLRGRGDGTFRRARQIRAGIPRPLAIATADMNGDGVPDVATANAGGGVSVLLGEGDGSLEPAVDHATKSTMCSSLTAADLNEDGIPDLVTTNSVLGNGASDRSISVLLGEPGGGFGSAVVYRHLGYQPTMATTADLNGDGHLDVIAPMGGWPGHYVTVLFGSGNGTLHDPVLLNAGPSAHDTVAVDLNGDGHVDLASSGLGTSYVVPTNQGIAIRPGRGDGTFSPIVRITDAWPSTTWRWPTSIGAADLNGDGRIDLIAPDERNDTVGVLLNRS